MRAKSARESGGKNSAVAVIESNEPSWSASDVSVKAHPVRVCFGGLPLGLVNPRHPSVAADVADRIHMQLPKSEVAKVGVVRGVRMRGKEGGAGAAPVSLDARARTEHRDPPVGERIRGAARGYQQRCAGI